MPSTIYGTGGAFGAPGPGSGGTYNAQGQYVPGGATTTATTQTGVAGGTAGQGTSSNPWGTTGTMYDPQNLNGGSSAALPTTLPVSYGQDATGTNQWGTTTSLYGGTQGIGADGTTNSTGDGYNYLNPRDKVTNSIFNYQLGGGNPNGFFGMKLK